MMHRITSFSQLVDEIDTLAEQWHQIEEGENFENYDAIVELEYEMLEAIASYSLYGP